MNKRKCLILLLTVILLCTGCSPLFIARDELIELDEGEKGEGSGVITAKVRIDEYEEVTKGTLLGYDAQNELMVLTGRSQTEEGTNASSLSTLRGSTQKVLFQSTNSYTEAKVDSQSRDIYFKERDNAQGKSALYWADSAGTKKVRLTEESTDRSLPWNISDTGILVYVDNQNKIVLGNNFEQVPVYSLPQEYNVKKIMYHAGGNLIFFLASTSQTSSVLYRLNLDGEKILSAIDVNVSDFTVSPARSLTAYTKTASTGKEQLYLYNHVTAMRSYVFSNYIEKLSFSPGGNFIAFATKVTEGMPTQSIWVMKYNNDIPVQLTANTRLASDIFWTEDEGGILFTTADTVAEKAGAEPLYVTFRLTFDFEYYQDKE